MKKTLLAVFFTAAIILLPKLVSAATLSLSPNSGSYSVGQIFSVNILLDTQGQSIDGVDIRYLNYNPSQLEVQDDNSSQAGVQINAGSLMPLTQANSVSNGKITFSQITAGGTTFKSTGAQTLATVRFKVLQSTNTTVSFDFVSGRTSDSNVASGGVDILTAVTNAAYGPTSQPPSAPYCGDGACNGTETCSSCSSDCGQCPSPSTPTTPTTPTASYCGDKKCNGKETCSTCASDCGKCPTTPPSSSPTTPPSLITTTTTTDTQATTTPTAATTSPLPKTSRNITTLIIIFVILIIIIVLFVLLRKLLKSLKRDQLINY